MFGCALISSAFREAETILVNYGRKEIGFVRRLRVPVTFAVYPTVVCQSLVVSELPRLPSQIEALKNNILEGLPSDADQEERDDVGAALKATEPSCLVQLTLNNVTQQDLDIRLAVRPHEDSSVAKDVKRKILGCSVQT